MPKSKSKMSLSQRRERAFQLFAKGYTNADVASELKVNKDTAAGYREKYEASLHAQASANPRYLQDVVTNTFRSFGELDQIRKDAWAHMKDRKQEIEFECPHCGEEGVLTIKTEVSDQTRVQYQNVLLKAQDQRSKLFGLMGVKQEIFVAVMQVKAVQDLVIDFLTNKLCAVDRAELESFLQSPEMAKYMSSAGQLEAGAEIMDLDSEEMEEVRVPA